ncbi:transcriptional regulator, TetR family [Desulfoluna spongiiphila]|uniref:Transcriptional regulator, TetR family n=2 Tax=Desulfoluna spongiiphila TaxID=419481 RepID=A0A1G5AFA0_9BACT|nr:transcriptional regulator, TetR family [Desulfoluna spongiiphila]VVS90643.1 tetracycline transcriptional regulator tetr-related c-terminal [Desulfoluna spongiiphila]
MEMIAEHGYHGTGLKGILDTAHVPKGSFYNYFKSKEDFVAEIIARYCLGMKASVDACMEAAGDDPVKGLRCVYGLSFAVLENRGTKGCLVGNLAAEIGDTDGPCRDAMHRGMGLFRERVMALIEEAQRRRLFRDDLGARALADIFWSTWQGALLGMKIDGDAEHLSQVMDALLDRLFRPDTP